jgi:hypothetical protein
VYGANLWQIHIFEIYIKIIIFALRTSSWIGPEEMKCPWLLNQHSDHCGFVQWYLVLSSNGHLWSASQVLLNLLDTLPSFGAHDAVVLFDNHCFGNLADEGSLDSLNEIDQLIACSVLFGRAQALLNLALTLHRANLGDEKWEKVYDFALGYRQTADSLSKIISHHNIADPLGLKNYIQRSQFERVHAALISPKTSASPIISSMVFEHLEEVLIQQDPQSYYICYFQSALDYARELSKDPPSPLSLTGLQLHDQGNLVGFIWTCDLCFAFMDNLLRDPESQYNSALLLSEVDSFLASQPPPPSEKTAKLIQYMRDLMIQLLDRVQRIFPKESLQHALQQSAEVASSVEEKSATFDIPLYLWAVHNDLEWLNILLLMEAPKLALPPTPSRIYVESGWECLPVPTTSDQLSQIADLVLETTQKRVEADEEAIQWQGSGTWQARESELDFTLTPIPTPAKVEPFSNAPVEVQRHESQLSNSFNTRPSAFDANDLAKHPFPDQRNSFVSRPAGCPPAQTQTGAVKECHIQTRDELSSSYIDICSELRADLMEGFQLHDDHLRRFAKQGIAQEVLRGDKLVQFFRCLELHESIVEHCFPHESVIARILVEKRLQEFLAILVFSMCDIEAARRFITKVLFSESWSSGRLEVPTSREVLETLFEDRTAADQFLANQAIFCPAVIQTGREVVIPSLDDRRFPYLEEQLLSQAFRVKVFKVKIAAGHFRRYGATNSSPIEIARKDYIMSGDSGKLQALIQKIFKPLLSLLRSCEYVIEIYASFVVSSLTYSVFMPLATCDLQQYMMESDCRRPLTHGERAGIIRNTIGLAEGLCFLHDILKTKAGFVSLDFGLNPKNVLIFPTGTSEYVWKLSDFGMSYINFREEVQEYPVTVGNVVLQRLIRPFQSKSQNPLRQRIIDQRVEGTYLPPETISGIPVTDNRSGVWSLGCMISVVFTYMDAGPDGVTEYAKERAKQERADRLDRFFLKSRPRVHHPAVKKWHRRLILQAKSRYLDEGKAVESTLRFLENAVFRKDSGRCSAETVKNQLQSTWEPYQELQSTLEQYRELQSTLEPYQELQSTWEDDGETQPTWGHYRETQERYQIETSRVNRLFQLPRTVIRRIVTQRNEREAQEEVNRQLEEQYLWLDSLSPITLDLDEHED